MSEPTNESIRCCPQCGYEMSPFQWINVNACPKCGARGYNDEETMQSTDTVQVSRTWLEAAKCPNTQCTDGVVPHQVGDHEWEAEQCQWCDERKALLAQETEG